MKRHFHDPWKEPGSNRVTVMGSALVPLEHAWCLLRGDRSVLVCTVDHVSPSNRAAWRAGGLFLVLAVLVATNGCTYRPHHPPRFEDFRRAYALGTDTTNSVLAQLAAFETGTLTEKELSKILAGFDAEAMIGAVTQTPLHDPLSLPLGLRAQQLRPTQPLIYAGLCYRLLSLIRNEQEERDKHLQMLHDTVIRWQQLDPSNSVPVYLEARYFLFLTNTPRASERILQANRMGRFETYEEPIRIALRRAYRSAAYPEYSALLLASSHSYGSMPLSVLGQEWLQAHPSIPNAVRETILLGQRIATGNNLLCELMGLHLQLKSMDKDPSRYQTEREKILSRREYLQRAARFLNRQESTIASEQRWIAFFETCSARGEVAATEELAKEMGYDLNREEIPPLQKK